MKVRNSLFVTFLFLTVWLYGQDSTHVAQDSIIQKAVKEPNPRLMNLGAYMQVGRLFAPSPGGLQQNIWIAGGVFIKRFQLGAFIAPYDDTYLGVIIFPAEFSLNYLYGGGYLGYTILQNKLVDFSATAAVGQGDLIWETTTSFENYFRDEFTMTHIILDIELVPVRFVRPIIQVGYRHMSEIDIPKTSASDFTGLTVAAGLRVGYYTKRPKK